MKAGEETEEEQLDEVGRCRLHHCDTERIQG